MADASVPAKCIHTSQSSKQVVLILTHTVCVPDRLCNCLKIHSLK